MKFSHMLFKPKWQDKDPGVRRAAVAGDSDSQLLAILPQLARTDADAAVRLTALKRLNQFELWSDSAQNDASQTVRQAAHEACVGLMCAADVDAPPLSQRMAALGALNETDLQRIASSNAPTCLRMAALEKTTRPRFLAQRASADPDAALRLAALQRITDASLLKRIVESTRKTDKVVNRLARERLHAGRVAAGDATAIGLHAHEMCERMETLMRNPAADIDAQLAQLDAAWSTLGNQVPASLQARYQGARALALRAVAELNNPRTTQPVFEQIPSTHVATDEAANAQAKLDALAAKARFAAELAAARELERNLHERELANHEKIKSMLAELDLKLNQGGMHAAHALHAHTQAQIMSLKKLPIPISRAWDEMQARYAELKRWQYWSNMQRRRELCADIEALAGSGMHPDALATRVRDAREEWQRLDAAEGLGVDGAQPESGIARRFQAVCHRALRPLQAYFSKRKEVRKSRAEQIDGVLRLIETKTDDQFDRTQLVTLRRQASTALHALDDVDPRARTQLAKRLKDAIARLGALTQSREDQVDQAKQALIARAHALATQTDARTLARDARALQQLWTQAGNGRRSHDQRQWREFRGACDAAFAKLDEARKAQAEDIKAREQQAQQLLAEFETLASTGNASTDQTRQQLRKLDEQWQSLGVDDRQLEQRLRSARESISAQLKDAARQRRLGPYILAMRKYALLRGLENGACVDADAWSGQQTSATQWDAALESRYVATRDNSSVGVGADELAVRELLVQLEFIAGIESPSEDQALRMQLQVQRLSSRMRDGAAPSVEMELKAAMATWFAQAAQSQSLETRFEQAAQTVIDGLP